MGHVPQAMGGNWTTSSEYRGAISRNHGGMDGELMNQVSLLRHCLVACVHRGGAAGGPSLVPASRSPCPIPSPSPCPSQPRTHAQTRAAGPWGATTRCLKCQQRERARAPGF